VDVVRRMGASPEQRALVLENGRLVGILSPSDVNRARQYAELAQR